MTRLPTSSALAARGKTAEARPASPAPAYGTVALLLAVAALAIWAGGMALALESVRLSDEGRGKVAVLFWPARGAEDNFRAIVAAGGEPVRPVFGSTLWIAHGPDAGFVGRLREHGARAAYGEIRFGPMFAGCFAYLASRTEKPPSFVVR